MLVLLVEGSGLVVLLNFFSAQSCLEDREEVEHTSPRAGLPAGTVAVEIPSDREGESARPVREPAGQHVLSRWFAIDIKGALAVLRVGVDKVRQGDRGLSHRERCLACATGDIRRCARHKADRWIEPELPLGDHDRHRRAAASECHDPRRATLFFDGRSDPNLKGDFALRV